MKQMILAVAALSCAVPAMAGEAYVGASLGRSYQDAYMGGFLVQHADYATGYKLFGGYHFTQNFGVEAGFANLGKLSVAPDMGSRLDVKPRSLYTAATATLPLTDKFSVSGKLGVAATRLTHTFQLGSESVSESHNRASPLVGIGASYALNEKVALMAEYENFGKVDKRAGEEVKAQMVSVGVRMKF